MARHALTADWPGGQSTMQVRLRVFDCRLPDESPLAVVCWLNYWSRADIRREAIIRDCRRHYGDVAVV